MEGDLDAIYEIQGLLPSGTWEYPKDQDGHENSNSDRFVMVKTVTIEIKVTVEE